MPLFRSRPAVISVAFVVVASLAAASAAPAVAQDAQDAQEFVTAQAVHLAHHRTDHPAIRLHWLLGRAQLRLVPPLPRRHGHRRQAGTPIHAAADGVITHVGWDQWGTRNWMVMINHGDGLTTWYAHLRGRDIAGINVGVASPAGRGDRLHVGHRLGHRRAPPLGGAQGRPLREPAQICRGQALQAAPAPAGRRTAASCDDVWIAAAPESAPGAATAMVLPGGDGAVGGDVSCAA